MENELQTIGNLIPENKKLDNIRENFDKNQKGPKSLEELVEHLNKQTNSNIFNDILNVLHEYASINIWSSLADDGGEIELDLCDDKIKKVNSIILPYLRRASSLFFPFLYEGARALYYNLRAGKEYISNENEYVLPYFIVLYAFKKSEHLFDEKVTRAIKTNFISKCARSLKGEETTVFSALSKMLFALNPDDSYIPSSDKEESIKTIVGIVKAVALYEEYEKNNNFDEAFTSFYNIDKKMGEELDFNSEIFDLHKNALYVFRNFLAENVDSLRDIDEEDDYVPVELNVINEKKKVENEEKPKKKSEKIDYKRNIRAAILFLNIFNLKLEKKDNVNQYTTLEIKNSFDKTVGKLYFEDKNVKIKTNTNFGLMTAEYEFSNFKNIELPENSDEFRSFYFNRWQPRIKYNIVKDENNRFEGDLLIDCDIDETYGASVKAHSILSYFQNGKKIINLIFQEDGFPFAVEITTDNATELIRVSLFNSYLDYINHEIKIYDNENNLTYRKIDSVAQKNEIESDMLRTFHYVEENNQTKEHIRNEFKKVVNDDDAKEAIIQKCNLINNQDCSLYEKINELRVFFRLGNTDLINILSNICLSSYDDDEVKAMLGFNRTKVNFQDGAVTNEEAYFGLGNDNKFLTQEEQKRLMYK